MLKSFFKSAFRSLLRHKTYTVINVSGLALGIACAILIFGMVKYQRSFDTYHEKSDRIYRVVTTIKKDNVIHTPGVPPPFAAALRSDHTFAEEAAMVAGLSGNLISVASGGSDLKFEENIAFAEPAFFRILDFPLLQGDVQSVLKEPNTAVITERMARKFFGAAEPVGQTIKIDNKLEVTITGILRDLPPNTDRREEIYLSYRSLKAHSPWMDTEFWLNVNSDMQCFVLLKPGVSAAAVNMAFTAFTRKHYAPNDAREWEFRLQPIADMHFNPDFGGYVDPKNLWVLTIIGLFLIVTAAVNFINLATSQALGRSREVGVRKALGGFRSQLFWQFIIETTLIGVLALVMAFFTALLALPYVNRLFDTQLMLNPFRDLQLLLFLAGLLVVVIFLSGSYPGLILARFPPVLALKGKMSQRHVGGFTLRRGLVITQFAISQVLIIGTIVMAGQMRYSARSDMGFQKDAIVMLPVPKNEITRLASLRAELAQIPGVEKTTFCYKAPASDEANNTGIRFDTRPDRESFLVSYRVADDQYVPTFGLQVIAGRNLYPSDTIREYLVNEALVKKLNIRSNEEVIGRKANINGNDGSIVGVIRNFHNKSFHEDIEPLAITTHHIWYSECAVKIDPAAFHTSLVSIEEAWKKVFPDHVYKYSFLNEQVAQFYRQDHIFLRLTQFFACIAIFIGCLGLYGLIAFMAGQRKKEMGIRKVLGASVQNIAWLFGKELTRLLLFSFLIAAPAAMWAMNGWLSNFVYHIEIGPGIFVLALGVTFVVTLFTVGYRSVKAALMNPVESLRSE